MNVNMFAQQVEAMQGRLEQLYQGANTSIQLEPQLLPAAFKELGVVSEELQVAAEELQQQNEELAATREMLEAERQRYQELFDFAPNGYLVTDTEGIIKEANRAAAKLLNVSLRFLIGKPLLIFVCDEEHHNFHTELTQLQKTPQGKDWAVRLNPRNREPFEAMMTVATIENLEGKVIGLRLCVRNVTREELRLHKLRDIERSDYELSSARPKHIFLKGEIIPLKPQVVWQVCQGIVKLNTMNENGAEVLVGLAGPSMPFGANLTSLQTYQATALSQVQLVCFSLTEIANSPNLAQTVLPKINQRLRQTEALLAISGQRRVHDRFHQLLLLLKQEIGQPMEQGTRLSVRLTHQNLADACSTTRVTITRLLGKLQAQGKVRLDSQSHIILIDNAMDNRNIA